MRSSTPLRSVLLAGRVLAFRPRLWVTAIKEMARFAPDAWWRRRPWLPMPDRELLRWRNVAMYGHPDHPVEADDLIRWLDWCRSENRRRDGSNRLRSNRPRGGERGGPGARQVRRHAPDLL